MNKVSESTVAMIKAKMGAGKSSREIADEMGISRTTVRRVGQVGVGQVESDPPGGVESEPVDMSREARMGRSYSFFDMMADRWSAAEGSK